LSTHFTLIHVQNYHADLSGLCSVDKVTVILHGCSWSTSVKNQGNHCSVHQSC